MAYLRSISTLGCPEYSLDQVIALAQRRGIRAIEIRALSNSVDLPHVFASAYGTPAKLAAHVARAPISIVSLNTSLKMADNTSADREAFLKFLPWAEACNVRWLRVFDGGHNPDAATYQGMAETLDWWRSERKRHGWQPNIMIETHDVLSSTAAIRHFLSFAPDTFILWDSHHTWRQGGEDPLTTWRAIKSHIVHIHVKDSVAMLGAKPPFSFVLPGEGEFGMAPLRAVLQEEFTGTVSMEWEKLWHPKLAPLEDALLSAARSGWW